MQTLILQCKPRKMTTGMSWLIEVLGPDGPAKDQVKQSIDKLENHPAKAIRRGLIDCLALIQTHGYEIKYTEHFGVDSEMEGWLFVLQKR
ncbi:MAG TPA: hypothetical protein PLD25_15650 [Chloroflexota bacterium]|nr:hypothetical protein [Chloroflexota bacterium]HUM67642.1 hypothetical protein [Chloroflexota bacterium]